MENMILASDFGGGKTLLLTEAARQMEKTGVNVFYISMLDPDEMKNASDDSGLTEANILDVALELSFINLHHSFWS